MREGVPCWLWYVDDGYGCGGVVVNVQGMITGGAPIFRRYRGLRLNKVRWRKTVWIGRWRP